MNAALTITRIADVDGWRLTLDEEDEPTIEDVELATRLGFARPRKLRELVERMHREGILNHSDVRPTVARTSIGIAERDIHGYRLTESGALKVIAKSETPTANAILNQVIRVFIAYRRGQLQPPRVEVPVLATTARVGENDMARSDLAARCRLAATALGVTMARIHGALRKQFLVVSVYHLPLVMLPVAREFLESLSLGRLLLSKPKARAEKEDPRQMKWSWN